MIMMNSAEFLANIFDLFHGIVHRMSKVVVLLHFADPSFRPGPAHKKVHLREMEKRPDGRRQSMGLFFRTALIFFGKCPFLPGENPIDCNKTITQVDGEKRIF